MAVTIEQVSDALISRIVSQVTAVNAKTCRAFPGFGYSEVMNFPFIGVAFDGGPLEPLTSDNAVVNQVLRFKLWVCGEDFRGSRYSMESSYSLLEQAMTALKGQQLGLEIAPIEITRIEPDQYLQQLGATVYVMGIETWQTRQ